MEVEKLNKDEVAQEVFKLLRPEATPHILSPYPDFFVPCFFTDERISEANSLKLYPDDVWIVTTPKAGTTWAQQIVKLIRNNGENDGELLPFSVPWPGANGAFGHKQDLAALPRPRSFKSHMPYHSVPGGPPNTQPCKYIYIARNPKDTIVSYYHHMYRGYVKHDESVVFPWDLYFRYYILGNVEFGDFFDHVLSWWAHKDDNNVLFLLYEDMKKDLPAAVARIAKFIDANSSEEVIAKVVSQTEFGAMKADNTANYAFVDKFLKPGTGTFMRKGEVGDWRSQLTAKQSAEVDELCREKLAGTGLAFDFGPE